MKKSKRKKDYYWINNIIQINMSMKYNYNSIN